MKNKKAVSLSIETLVIIILGVIALIVILVIFSSGVREVFSDILEKIRTALGLWESAAIE
jgi:hypothetical protein